VNFGNSPSLKLYINLVIHL